MKYIILDLECTCWDRNDPNYDEHETIEIGIVFLDENYNKIDQLDIFVTPTYNPTLSEYCIGLTGITQEKLNDEGMPFKDAIAALRDVIAPQDVLFCSWGSFDKNQLKRECKDHNIEYPFSDDHLNIKVEFMKMFRKKRMGLQKACRFFGLRFIGVPHSGICDANMTAEVFKKMRTLSKP